MEKISEMIERLCPDGVENVRLDSVCSFTRGKTITAKNAVEGTVPVIAGGQTASYYHNEANRTEDTVVVAGSGAYAGFVSYWQIPIYVSDAFSVDPNETLQKKYLFYFLKQNQQKIFETQKGAGVPHVHGKDIAGFEIPLPPLSIQQEIVRILDSFTSMITNLETELASRQKQYEYYRNKLLTFDKYDESVEWKVITDVFDTRNGYTPSTQNASFWENGVFPWFKMEDIREKGHILSDSNLHITQAAIKGKGLFKANSIILATSATIGEHALITVEHLSNQRFTNFYPKKDYLEKIDMKYMHYYFFLIDTWCKEHTIQGNFAGVNMSELYNHIIPVPSLERQSEIVSTLDTFESLISNIKQELEARKKQYEYYREQLLTFRPSPAIP